MREGYIIRDQAAPHFITATVVDWIDVFTRQQYKDIIISSLDYSINNKGLVVFAYVVMSNHVHLIVQAKDNNLSDLIRDFKKFTATTIVKEIKESNDGRFDWMLDRFEKATESHSRNKNFQFWQYGNHPKEVFSEKFLWSKIDYIHLNPVRAGIVKQVEDYIYSSASNYIKDEGVLGNIQIADNPVIDVLKPSSFDKYLRM